MASVRIDRAMVVKCRVETHAGTHAGAFHFAAVVNFRGDCMPGKLCLRAVGQRIDPAFVDGPRHTVGVDGGARRFKIGIVAVEKLVPETGAGLIGDQPSDMFSQQIQYFIASGMTFWNGIQHFNFR